MKVLSFSAKAQHGKDTAARLARELAREEFGARTMHWAFAWPLKARVYAEGFRPPPLKWWERLLGREQAPSLTWDDIVTKPPHVRKLLQEVGTEKGREVFGEHFWVAQTEAFLNMMEEAMEGEIDLLTISDTRFPNELHFVHDRGGDAIYIMSNRPTLTGEAAKHPSETALDHLTITPEWFFEGVLDNDTTVSLEALKDQIRPYVRRLLEGT